MRKLLALVLLLVLTGCAQLPTGVSVSKGPELVLPLNPEFAYYSPPGPTEGASPIEIVSGFLNAGSAPQQNYAIAREYLSSQFAQNWQPNAGVLIRSGIPVLRGNSQSLVTAEIPLSARISELGIYTPVNFGDNPSLRFQLVQEDGQWRISRAPNLTVVTVPVFNVVFRGYPIYFLDATRETLVPDLRWFPSRTSTGTSLVNALLAGPSEWLAPAVTTAIPEGTKLTVDAVQVVDGQALVDFDANALSAQPNDRSLILAQLEATLIQLFGVQRVQVSINNNPQAIESVSLRQIPVSNPTAFGPEGVYSLTSGNKQPIPGTEQLATNYEILSYDISDDGNKIVILHSQGISQFNLGEFGSEDIVDIFDPDLLEPQFDIYGNSWVVPTDSLLQARAITKNSRISEFDWNSPGSRIAYAVSPEGARVAELVKIADSHRVLIRPVIRDLAGVPRSIGDAETVIELSGTMPSLAWDNLTSLIAFDTSSGLLNSIQVIPVSGPKLQLPSTSVVPKKAISGFGNATRYLISEQGEVWALTGRSWRKVSDSAFSIAMQD